MLIKFLSIFLFPSISSNLIFIKKKDFCKQLALQFVSDSLYFSSNVGTYKVNKF